jgi:hypothetical protein
LVIGRQFEQNRFASWASAAVPKRVPNAPHVGRVTPTVGSCRRVGLTTDGREPVGRDRPDHIVTDASATVGRRIIVTPPTVNRIDSIPVGPAIELAYPNRHSRSSGISRATVAIEKCRAFRADWHRNTGAFTPRANSNDTAFRPSGGGGRFMGAGG